MPLVRNIAEGGVYQPAAGERLLQWQNTAQVPLYLGIRKGEYMIAATADGPQVTYVLTEEQYVRLQQQLASQAAYKNWIASGLLTLVEVDELPVPPPPPPPPPAPTEDDCEPEELPVEP
jgi:hypothetical protein